MITRRDSPSQLAVDASELKWADSALCAEVDYTIFFPEKGESARPAKSVCARCEVSQQCAEYALANNVGFGIWGGLSARQRNALRYDRKAA